MKKDIHPKYKLTTITCACGEVIHTSSTKQDIKVEICSKCHPFFTGKQKFIDSAGRVEKFKKKYSGVKKEKLKKPSLETQAENLSDEEAENTDVSGTTE